MGASMVSVSPSTFSESVSRLAPGRSAVNVMPDSSSLTSTSGITARAGVDVDLAARLRRTVHAFTGDGEQALVDGDVELARVDAGGEGEDFHRLGRAADVHGREAAALHGANARTGVARAQQAVELA